MRTSIKTGVYVAEINGLTHLSEKEIKKNKFTVCSAPENRRIWNSAKKRKSVGKINSLRAD